MSSAPGKTESVPCPRCVKGTVVIKGSMWWQDQHLRCSYCQGTGRIVPPVEDEGKARVRILDLYCCQGGAGKGYADAGFRVVGVDSKPQPRYPFEFHQEDAIHVLLVLLRGGGWFGHRLEDFDAIHASPPCQFTSKTQRIQGNRHPDLIRPTRDLLVATGLPYVIENVEGAPLHDPVMLCGAMFPELRVYRHRLFETNWPLEQPAHPEHVCSQVKMGRPPLQGQFIQCVGNFSNVDYGRDAMGMPWATREGLREAIPPAYTRWIGERLLEHLNADRLEQAA